MADGAEDLAAVADGLYALEPEEFTAARTEAAKANPALKKALGELRRPTVSAWVVNVLAREDAALLGSLLELGPALAEAQRSGSGTTLRELSEQRRQLLGAVVQRAVELSGREVSATVRAEVESTLDAGLVDPEVAAAVRSGQLVRPLSFAGFGGVDLEGAVGVKGAPARQSAGRARPRSAAAAEPATTTGPRSAAGGARAAEAEARRVRAEEELRERTAAAEQQALEAAGELDDAVRVHDQAAEQHSRAVAAAERARTDVEDAEQAVADAKEAEAAARQEAQATDTALGRAARAVARAQTVAEKARADLDALRRG